MSRLFFAFLSFSLLSVCGCRGSPESHWVEAFPESGIQQAEGFTMVKRQAGMPRWILKADRVRIVEDKGRAYLENPHVEFFKSSDVDVPDKNGPVPASIVSAERGELDMVSHDMDLTGSVEAVALQGENKLATSRIHYSCAKNLISSDADVTLKRPGATVTGSGFQSDPGLEKVVVRNQRTVIAQEAAEGK